MQMGNIEHLVRVDLTGVLQEANELSAALQKACQDMAPTEAKQSKAGEAIGS